MRSFARRATSLPSEIGSVVAAVKKKILSEGGEDARWDQPNDEIKEELGDALWYCYSTAQIINNGYYDILAGQVSALRTEIVNGDERAQKIATSLARLIRGEAGECSVSL
jgi:NTP pyrophosphatase (non-canonical NTP hydrolase)